MPTHIDYQNAEQLQNAINTTAYAPLHKAALFVKLDTTLKVLQIAPIFKHVVAAAVPNTSSVTFWTPGTGSLSIWADVIVIRVSLAGSYTLNIGGVTWRIVQLAANVDVNIPLPALGMAFQSPGSSLTIQNNAGANSDITASGMGKEF